MNVAAFLMILDGLLLLAARTPVIWQRLKAIHAELGAMKAEGRDPTPEEWEAVGKRIDARLARLKSITKEDAG